MGEIIILDCHEGPICDDSFLSLLLNPTFSVFARVMPPIRWHMKSARHLEWYRFTSGKIPINLHLLPKLRNMEAKRRRKYYVGRTLRLKSIQRTLEIYQALCHLLQPLPPWLSLPTFTSSNHHRKISVDTLRTSPYSYRLILHIARCVLLQPLPLPNLRFSLDSQFASVYNVISWDSACIAVTAISLQKTVSSTVHIVSSEFMKRSANV